MESIPLATKNNNLQRKYNKSYIVRYNLTFIWFEVANFEQRVLRHGQHVRVAGWKALKQKLKIITRKTTPCTFDERIYILKEVHRGWLGYYRIANIQEKLKDLDSWLRNRLRYCIWKQWKKPERKRKNLIRLGVDHEHAYSWSRTRMGGWAVAQSPILTTTITLERLRKRRYESMLEVYQKIAPHLNEPLYTRTVRTVV